MNDCAVSRATGIPRETVRDWRRQGMSSHECDRVNSTSAGVMERQTCEPQKLVGASPCGFESHLRHHSNRSPGPRRTWSDEQLVDAVPACISLRAVLRRLGLHPTGASYKTLQLTIARLGLDTRHFLGQGHLRGKSHGWARRLPLDAILVANSAYMSMWNLKRRLVSGGLLESKCSECGLTECEARAWSSSWTTSTATRAIIVWRIFACSVQTVIRKHLRSQDATQEGAGSRHCSRLTRPDGDPGAGAVQGRTACGVRPFPRRYTAARSAISLRSSFCR
jgi:hypothetical protein